MYSSFKFPAPYPAWVHPVLVSHVRGIYKGITGFRHVAHLVRVEGDCKGSGSNRLGHADRGLPLIGAVAVLDGNLVRDELRVVPHAPDEG